MNFKKWVKSIQTEGYNGVFMHGYYSRAVCSQERVSLICIMHIMHITHYVVHIKFWNITCKLVILEMVVIFFQHSFLLFLNNFCPLWYFWTILVDPMAPHHVTKHLQPLKSSINFRKVPFVYYLIKQFESKFSEWGLFFGKLLQKHKCILKS